MLVSGSVANLAGPAAPQGGLRLDAEFKRLVSRVIADDLRNNHMPDSTMRLEERHVPAALSSSSDTAPIIAPLNPDTYHAARVCAPIEFNAQPVRAAFAGVVVLRP